MPLIALEPLHPTHAGYLVEILNYDLPLALANGSDQVGQDGRPIEPVVFMQQCNEWMQAKKGQTYAILLDGRPIGTISLSMAGLLVGHGRIGYWLTSSHWRRGYGTEAFRQLLAIARAQGLKRVETAFIETSPAASVAIWRRAGARFMVYSGGCQAVIDLSHIDSRC